MGTIFKTNNSVVLGVVIRDNCGEVIGVLFLRIPIPQIVVEAEALASRKAFQFVAEIGLSTM